MSQRVVNRLSVIFLLRGGKMHTVMNLEQIRRIRRFYLFILIVLLLLSGCTGTDGSSDVRESIKDTADSTSEQKNNYSETIIKSLTDRIGEWTEGQFYPGSYKKTAVAFQCPGDPTAYVNEAAGVVYAYGLQNNKESNKTEHVVRRISEEKQKDVALSGIPIDYLFAGLFVGDDVIYIWARPADSTTVDSNNKTELFIYTTEGEFRFRKKLADLVTVSSFKDTSLTGFTDYNGNLWIRVLEDGLLYCINRDGILLQSVEVPLDFQGGSMRGKHKNELIAVLGAGSNLIFGKMNTETGASENNTLEGLPGVVRCFPSTEYDALVMTERSLYGVTLGESVIASELLVFTDLGLDNTMIRSIEDYSDGSLSILLLDRTKTEGEKVTLIPQKSKVREGLVLACLKSSDFLRYAVSLYNQANPNNKITIKEYYDKYAVDTSETDALKRLNSDLMDGTAGDIVCLDGFNFFGGGRTYLDKGAFLDLYELMDNDPEFHAEDYFTDIWRINETDGKLYRLIPFFSVNTKYGRVDDVGETTHIDESLLFETEPVTNLFGPLYRRTEFIHDLLVFTLGDFKDSKAILYDTDQMTRYIEVAGKLSDFPLSGEKGEEEQYDEYNQAVNQVYHDLANHITRFYYNKAEESAYLSLIRHASAALGEGHDMMGTKGKDLDEFFRSVGVEITYSGFPVKEGCGSALVNRVTLAISAGTEAREEAWSFLKTTLSDDYQSIKKLSYDAIPVKRKVFQENIGKLFEYTRDSDPLYHRGFGGSNPETGWEVNYWVPATKQWMVDAFLNLLPNITLVDEVDPHVEAIVTEEITKYCDGRQTAEEAARNIAERVELYRDEQ